MSETVVQEQVEAPKTKPKKNGAATGDVISDFAHEIQTMNKVKVLHLADKLVEAGDENDFRLGGALSQIAREKWYEGFDSLGAFTQSKYGFADRKARYLIENYEALVTKGIPWEKVKGLGWTKLARIAKVLTVENVDEWVEKALKLTVIELETLVAGAKGGGEEGTETTGTSEFSTFKVKLKNDQIETVRAAIAKAKADVNTEFDSVALEAISAGFLGGTIAAAKSDPVAVLKGLGWKAAIELFDATWPEITFKAEVPEAWLEAEEKKG